MFVIFKTSNKDFVSTLMGRAWLGAILGWVTFWEVSRKRVGEDKTRWKDSCWFVGPVGNPKSSLGSYTCRT